MEADFRHARNVTHISLSSRVPISQRLSLLLLASVLPLAACATSYHPRGSGMMGYYEWEQATDRWEVDFNVQRQSDWATLDQYVTIQHPRSGFPATPE